MNAVAIRLDIAHFKRKLLNRSSALRAEIRETLLRTDQEPYTQLAGLVHDAGDESIADLLVDVNLAEISRDVAEIRDIEAALRRISNGTYGFCVNCGESVDRERLEAYPTAKRCLPCQQAHDRAHAVPIPSTF